MFYYSDSNPLHFGVITCSLGARYKQYCSNIVRTIMVDPTQKQQDMYEFLLKVEDEILGKLQHGKLRFKFVFLNNSSRIHVSAC